MKQKKEFLRQRFIDFQMKIAELSIELRKQKDASLARENKLYLDLIELMDAFEGLEETIRAKEEGMDETARMMARSIRAVHRKLSRIIEANHISRIVFPDNKARMHTCKIVDTQEAADMENETILTVVKNGYIHDELGLVLRKAEVITVLNG
jgi:molecular chaperone GrpE (heat shock protein)